MRARERGSAGRRYGRAVFPAAVFFVDRAVVILATTWLAYFLGAFCVFDCSPPPAGDMVVTGLIGFFLAAIHFAVAVEFLHGSRMARRWGLGLGVSWTLLFALVLLTSTRNNPTGGFWRCLPRQA